MRERILSKGVDPERITIVRDAVDLPDSLPSVDHPVVREIRGAFRFVLVHAGNLGFYGAWQTLINAARLLERDGVGLVFVGEGAMKDAVQASARGCSNIRFLPFRPAAEVPCVMAAGDLHVVTVKRGLEGVVVPSKVYNILAAARPLLAVATEKTEVARFAERDGCGIAADPDSPEAVAVAVRGVLGNPERLARHGPQVPGPGSFLRSNQAAANLCASHRGGTSGMIGLISFAVALLASLTLTIPVRQFACAWAWWIKPGHRKIHVQPIPLLGGIAIYCGRTAGHAVLTRRRSPRADPGHSGRSHSGRADGHRR